MKEGCIFYILLLIIFILFAKNEIGNINALIIESNPFYWLSNGIVKSNESTTDDNLINIKLEYLPQAFQIGSPEFFKVTLFYKSNNQSVLHADTDVIISKNGKEIYKESNEFSQPYVHTQNGIVLSSYKFLGSGHYVISIKICRNKLHASKYKTSKFCGQCNWAQGQISGKYNKITKWVWQNQAYKI